MMLETILKRRSYRGKYKNVKVPREHLTAIMEAGLAAPSGCNKQTTSLIAVDDEAILTDADRIGDKMAKILGVPDAYELVCMLPVGITEEEPFEPKKKRFEEHATDTA
ncbi:MAG: nitroreductase family protein [Lachnospiraceae bacterium]|nr:nitroreductase family protein [Lachnospiraceae bacterium]